MTTGVIVGRFQTPYLHEGHKKLIDTAFAENDLVFIFIGHKPNDELDNRNPYTYYKRLEMIKREYPNALVSNLPDVPDNDVAWSAQLDRLIEGMVNPKLYGSRDSFISHYHGFTPYREVEEVVGVSATKIREQLKEQNNGTAV